jgi:peptidoglycan/LPS O-acetylase OafA/YrhL
MTSSQQTPAGWYPDPSGSGRQRYWDGNQWTDNYSPAAAPAAAQPAGPLPSLWWGAPAATALLVLGAIGPWATIDIAALGQSASTSKGGLDSDGVLTLVLALIAGGLLGLWRAQRARWQPIVAAVLGALAALIAIIDIGEVSGTDTGLGGAADVSVGWGLWVTLVGAIVLIVVSALLVPKSRRNG